jgi:hypothetical protein
MSQNVSVDDIAKRRIVYTIPAMERVRVERDVEYAAGDAGALLMDLYYPPDGSGVPPDAAVILVTGYPDPGVEKILGRHTRHMGTFVSWAQLLASSGMVAITYANQDPADVRALFDYVCRHAPRLGIDPERLGLWSCSGHGPNALALLMHNPRQVRCACLMSAYTLDRAGSSHVAEASATFRFVTAGRSIDDMPAQVPVMLARAGADQMPGLNAALDAFVSDALDRNLPMTMVNHPTGPHAFDVFEDSETSRELIRSAVRFLEFHLRVDGGA